MLQSLSRLLLKRLPMCHQYPQRHTWHPRWLVDLPQVRAWENNTYFAVSNLAGRDLVYSYFGEHARCDMQWLAVIRLIQYAAPRC
mgnify:CR=1 FL=1